MEVKDWVTGEYTLIPLAGPAKIVEDRFSADSIALCVLNPSHLCN